MPYCGMKFLAALLLFSCCCQLPNAARARSNQGGAQKHQPLPETRRIQPADSNEFDVCSFFASGQINVGDELSWGKRIKDRSLCDTSELTRWRRAAKANCYECGSNEHVCGSSSPRLLFHMYVEGWHPTRWHGNLYSLQAYLMTQDLTRSHMMLWSSNVQRVTQHPANTFIQRFGDAISWNQVEWDAIIEGTVLVQHPFWGDSERVIKQFVGGGMRTPAAFSDVLRIVLLAKYGGVWLDYDTVLLHDLYPVTVQVGYQFLMRWMNNHVFYLKRRSPLSLRLLDLLAGMPWPDTQEGLQKLINNTCKPVNYFPMSVSLYGNEDIYNACLMRLALYRNNTGPPDAVLYDQPLGWYDQSWPNCVKQHTGEYSREQLVQFFQGYLAIHTRYPKFEWNYFHEKSFVKHALHICSSFFSLCHSPACVPREGLDLLAYEDVIVRMKRIPHRGRTAVAASARAGTSDGPQPVIAAATGNGNGGSGSGNGQPGRLRQSLRRLL